MQKTDLTSINLNLLVALQALMETRSVSGAAKKLNLSQPAVSRSLAQLRDLFGDELFVRASRGMIPTSRSEELAGPLAALLQGTIDLLSETSFDPAGSTNVFRIATTDYGATAVLAPVLETLISEAPHTALEIMPFSSSVFAELAAGNVDLVLYSDDEAPPNLRSRMLFIENYVCLVRRDHPVTRRTKERQESQMNLEDFLAWPHALVTVFGGRRGVVDAALGKCGAERKIAAWIPYFSVAPLMIAGTDTILTLPSRIAAAFGDMESLVCLRPPIEIDGFGYRLLWHERTHNDPALRWLRRLIASTLETANAAKS